MRPSEKTAETPATDVRDARALAIAAARAAAEKQAEDTLVLDMRDLLAVTDFFVITSGTSERQVRTIADSIEAALREGGARPTRREGEGAAGWLLLDYIDMVVHVFGDEERDYYSLERLWRDAPLVPWEDVAQAATERPSS